jgi:hypothetical protein
MTGKQPKQGNVKLTISIKKETRDALNLHATKKHKLGLIIDDLVSEKYLEKQISN